MEADGGPHLREDTGQAHGLGRGGEVGADADHPFDPGVDGP
jgi:hypothetical protein